MNINKYNFLIATIITLCIILTGCKETEPVNCPLTDLGWETTEEDLAASEGEALSTYDSIYGGLTYTYDSIYKEKTGTLKYMYDEEGVLMSVGWAYASEDPDELLELYELIHTELEETHGKSGYTANEDTNYGDVWRLDEGHIIISVVLTNSNKVFQVSYVSPLNEE